MKYRVNLFFLVAHNVVNTLITLFFNSINTILPTVCIIEDEQK